MSPPKNVGASVRARLLNRAKENESDYGLILTKYALERFLYRLSVSQSNDAFLLKGALLFDLWFDQPHRPTRDIDLLGFGSSEVDDVAAVFRDVCVIACEDGMAFDATTVRAAEIRKEANYAGVRVTLLGVLEGARCAVQIDVGYGDAITPEPERVSFPVLLEGMAAPLGLSDTFTQDSTKIAQWKAFLGKNKLQAPPLDELIGELRPLLWGKNACYAQT